MLSNLPEAALTAGVGFKPWPAGPTARASCPAMALTLHLMGISAGAETETEEETETWERQRWRPRQRRRRRQRRGRPRDTAVTGQRWRACSSHTGPVNIQERGCVTKAPSGRIVKNLNWVQRARCSIQSQPPGPQTPQVHASRPLSSEGKGRRRCCSRELSSGQNWAPENPEGNRTFFPKTFKGSSSLPIFFFIFKIFKKFFYNIGFCHTTT